MKNFKELILEAKDRFFLKSKILTSDQKEELINFSKTHSKFEKMINDEIGWYNVHKVSYETFLDIKNRSLDTKSMKKRKARKLRHKGIRGLKEGEDYINIKTKNPYYLTYLPLNYKAAQVIKTSHIGDCIHNGCIGGSQAPKFFKSEGKAKNRVPVYVIGQGEKYVVMMYPSTNSVWEVWAKENIRPETGEVIPNFSIKKELATPKLMNLYKDVLYNVWKNRERGSDRIDPIEYDNAVNAYNHMVSDIEDYYGQRINALEQHQEHNDEVLKDTIEKYEEMLEDLKYEKKQLYSVKDKVKNKLSEIKKIIEVEPTGTGTSSDGEVVWNFRGIDYTMDELINIHKITMAELDNYEDSIIFTKKQEDIDNVQEIIDTLKDFSDGGYEFEEWALSNGNDVDFTDYISSEEYVFDDIYSSYDLRNHNYDDYFEFMEKYTGDEYGEDEREEGTYEMYQDDSDIIYGGGSPDGESILHDIGFEHPSEIV